MGPRTSCWLLENPLHCTLHPCLRPLVGQGLLLACRVVAVGFPPWSWPLGPGGPQCVLTQHSVEEGAPQPFQRSPERLRLGRGSQCCRPFVL
eukprot:scaffold5572_cov390-Prasinococcus_capsulatus_cf.AAC.4